MIQYSYSDNIRILQDYELVSNKINIEDVIFLKKILILLSVGFTAFLVGCDTTTQTTTNNINDVVDTSETSEDLTSSDIDTILDEELDQVTSINIDFTDVYQDYSNDVYTLLTPDSDSYTITTSGVYVLEGTFLETIVIDVIDEDVTLILNNATIQSNSGPAILVINADDVTISAPSGTLNLLEDTLNHPLSTDDQDYNAVIYSTADLLFNGAGTINVNAYYNNAINSKDDIKIIDTTLNITSIDDGIIGRDSIAISNANLNLDVGGDALKSTNDENTEKGFIFIASGSIALNAGADAIQAENEIIIHDGTFDIEASDKGIKSKSSIIIGGGSFTIQSIDDGINSNTEVKIYDGVFTISTTDDAIHADEHILIEGGTITITMCYEGIESNDIEINGGTITLTASDDGLQAQSTLAVNGGIIQISSGGDGFDCNGSAVMTDGYLVINGPTSDRDGAIDYDRSFNVSGGLIIAIGSSGMAQAPSTSSSQSAMLFANSTTYNSGTVISLYDDSGTQLLSIETTKNFASVVISSSKLVVGDSYTLEIGTSTTDFTQSTTITTLGIAGGFTPDGGTRPPGR